MKTSRSETIQERVRRLVDSDPVTIADQVNFRARWGGYPSGGRKFKNSKEWNEGRQFNPSVQVKHAAKVSHPDQVMVARNEFFEGRAVWYYEVGTWACRSADECLSFLLKKSVAAAQLELTRRGFSWEWVK